MNERQTAATIPRSMYISARHSVRCVPADVDEYYSLLLFLFIEIIGLKEEE